MSPESVTFFMQVTDFFIYFFFLIVLSQVVSVSLKGRVYICLGVNLFNFKEHQLRQIGYLSRVTWSPFSLHIVDAKAYLKQY